MTSAKSVVFDHKKRVSESYIWEAQKRYYLDKGINAWSESVPFYITSNAFIANQYAKVIVSFISDWVAEHPQSAQHPFPILELGAGSGQLSYYLCTELKAQLTARSLKHVKLRYIISDISTKNLDFIHNHPVMQELIEDGLVSFSCFDAENDQIIKEYPSSQSISIKNPLISISNYVFDSLTVDVFYVKNKQLFESLVSLSTATENLIDGKPKDWEQVNLSYSNEPITEHYYEDSKYNQLLQMHNIEELDDTYFIFPLGSLNALKNLSIIANGCLFNLLSDKAFSQISELAQQEKPELDVHGSISMMVNLFAISEYNAFNQGEQFIPTSRDGLTTAILCSGIDLASKPLLNYQLQTCFENFSPTDYYNLYDHLSRDSSHWELPELVSILALSCWDPGLFQLVADHLQDQIETSDSQVVDRLASALPAIAEKFYYIPSSDDTLFGLANIYYAIGEYREALDLYEMSLIYYPNEYETLFNIGLCYYYLEEYETSIDYLNQALQLNPKAADCRAQIERATKKLS
jgi:tetratricopeptide (TPR) repeat protein